MSCWLEISKESHFPLQNIPFGVYSLIGNSSESRCASRIGDFIIDLKVIFDEGLFQGVGLTHNVFANSSLNEFMSCSKPIWQATRNRLIDLFTKSHHLSIESDETLKSKALVSIQDVEMQLPCQITEYTDFYSSREHATNVGIMFRGIDNALQPNWLHLPVGYHGRASSIVVSGTDIRRPCGQVQKNPKEPKDGSNFQPCNALDFELEIGCLLGGQANPLGIPISMAEAEDRIFGLVLLNDWSARDIQAWEYVPLGPFTAKNFGTSISPWIITLDALEQFRCEPSAGPIQENPTPLPYLHDPNYSKGTYNLNLEVGILPSEESNTSLISQTNFKYLYWNVKQQLVHHSVTGCVMRPGDLLGSGTISGTEPNSFGSMLELSWKGSKEIILENSTLPQNKTRKYLVDGDTVVMSGFAQGEGYRVGFGEVKGKILPPYLR